MNRINSNARIPENIFDLHKRNVQEKHAADGLYMGIAAEMAIREYLDKDDGAELEERLRERCTSVGSSPPKRKKLVADSDSSEKRKAQWRIREELKEELKAYAKETDNTYSDVFALAIREYWTNSRLERIEALYDRLETAIEPFEDQIDSDGVNASVVDQRTGEIARELGDGDLLRSDIEAVIGEVRNKSDYNLEKYTPLVAERKGLEEHPMNQADSEKPDIFISHEKAERLREDPDVDTSEPSLFEQSFDALTSDERVLRVCAQLYRKAESHTTNGKAQMDHSDVMDEFDDEPGGTTGYKIMGIASEANGYTMAEPHGTKQLRVDIEKVDDQEVIEAATGDSDTSATEDVSGELDYITSAEPAQ